MNLWYIPITVGYIIVGLIWGFLRWKQYVDGELAYYEQQRLRFLIYHRVRGDTIPDHLLFEWRDAVQKNVRLRDIPPQISTFGGEIAFDVVVWPLSMLSVIVQIGFRIFMESVLAGYNKATDAHVERIKKDLKK